MSKIFKFIASIFNAIYRIIDKFIVTPISRLVYKINEILKDNSSRFEKILNRPNVLIYVSLICAITIFLLIDSKVINLTEREAEIITDQKVTAIYNKEAYVVEGIPENTDITLIGSKSTIYIATQLGEHEVILDLSKYGPGTYKVPLKYNHNVPAVDYKLDPSTVTVKISEKVSEVKSLTWDIMNADKLDKKLSISNITLDTNEVIVKSSQEILDKVASVKALVDATQIDIKESGNFTIENVTLAAYDEFGERIANIEMVPSKVTATITVDSYHAKKPVKVITKGTMSNGKAIASITSSVKEVEIYGEKEVVDKIQAIEAEILIDNLSNNKNVSVNLIKPSGIRYMSESTTNIQITVGGATQKTVSGVYVNVEGLSSSYSASAISEDEQQIAVVVKGVKSVVDKDIEPSKIYAYVDLSGLKAGTHTVGIQVKYMGDEPISVQSTKSEITVKIIEK